MKTQYNLKIKKSPLVIKDFEQFKAQLYRRLFAVLYHVEDIRNNCFLIIKHYDRSSAQRIKDDVISFAGLREVRKTIETFLLKIKEISDIDYNWRMLDVNKYEAYIGTQSFEELQKLGFVIVDKTLTRELLVKYEQGDFRLSDIKARSLSDYFKLDTHGIPDFVNKLRENEFPIFKQYFNIETDYLISIPLIELAEFEGVVHIVFSAGDKLIFDDENVIKRIIKLFSIEYESLLLDWDLVGGFIYETSNIELEKLQTEEYYKRVETNSLLTQLNYKDYYDKNHHYLRERIKENNVVPLRFKRLFRRNAIVTILLDSYSHNISAHSLTALRMWQTDAIKIVSTRMVEIMDDDEEFVVSYRKYLQEIRNFEGAKFNPLIEYSGILSVELQPFFKYLYEKGAFWSGVHRETSLGGDIVNLYEILWDDFINNSLYLGTIANSEKIYRINFHFTFYNTDTEHEGFMVKKNIDFEGNLAILNLRNERQLSKEKTELEENHNIYFRSAFVDPGENYQEIKKRLKDVNVFFPGGVVGKHAFFTLLENEIRNVKHYRNDALKEIQNNGLTLNISVQPFKVNKFENNTSLYRIGIWLHHKAKLDEINSTSLPIIKKHKGLQGDIINEFNKPRLGGSIQDKICAAKLFTGLFDDVQKNDNGMHEQFYPYVISATEDIDNYNQEFVISSSNYNDYIHINLSKPPHSEFDQEICQSLFDIYNHKSGYLKKYIHLWKGEELRVVHDNEQLQWDNLSRFRIVAVESMKAKLLARKSGIIRIVDISDAKTQLKAYRGWLNKWLNLPTPGILEINMESNPLVRIVYNHNNLELITLDIDTLWGAIDPNTFEIKYKDNYRFIHSIDYIHGGKTAPEGIKMCFYRSHGRMLEKFWQAGDIEELKDMSPLLLYEYFETIMTRVCIFDNRIAERITGSRAETFSEQMNLEVYPEALDSWEKIKQRGLKNLHFLIIHLSFIESLRDQYGNSYTEANINEFIENEIQNHEDIGTVDDNFVFVITTGRGRAEWWDKIKEDPKLMQFTTFRPIEAIISSIDSAIQINDDFDLKYNLIKVLFGS